MRKNWKKFLASACAATMLASSVTPVTALADLGDSYIGEGAIENDNSILPNITNVVLSTITDTTYNFRVDPDQLLGEFDPNLYDNTANMYFENIGTPLSLALATDYSFFIKSMVEYDTDSDTTTPTTTSIAEFVTWIENYDTFADLETALDAAAYYVWQPTEDMIGLGQYVQITSANYPNFVTITPDPSDEAKIGTVVADTTPKMSEGDVAAIWDGKIYTTKYTEVTDVATEIVPLFSTETWTFDESVYVGLGTNAANTDTYYGVDVITVSDVDAAAVDTTAGTVVVNYTPAVSKYKTTSLSASITNKSTFDIAVTANVQVTGAEGLNFVYSGDGTAAYTDVAFGAANTGDATTSKGAGSETAANVALVIADAGDSTQKKYASIIEPATAKTTINADGEVINVTAEASAYYVLRGSGTESNLYTLGEIEEATLSNIYYRYLNQASAATSNTASFIIAGETDTRAYDGTDTTNQGTLLTAWDKYIADLSNGIATRPQIDVVYTFSKVTSSDNKTFTDLDKDTYATDAGTPTEITNTAWVEKTDVVQADALVAAAGTTYTYGTEFSMNYYPSTAEIVSLLVGDEEAYGYEIVDNVITFNAIDNNLAALAQATATGTNPTVTVKLVIVDATADTGVKELDLDVTVTGCMATN